MRKSALISKGINPHLYYAWQELRRRCDCPWREKYRRYGGRGITYHQHWAIFANFVRDMGSTWFKGAVLDRKDNDGHYCIENCRWVTKTESARNNSRIKLSVAIAEEIRQRYKTGQYTQRQLASLFNTDRGSINEILHDRLWV